MSCFLQLWLWLNYTTKPAIMAALRIHLHMHWLGCSATVWPAVFLGLVTRVQPVSHP